MVWLVPGVGSDGPVGRVAATVGPRAAVGGASGGDGGESAGPGTGDGQGVDADAPVVQGTGHQLWLRVAAGQRGVVHVRPDGEPVDATVRSATQQPQYSTYNTTTSVTATQSTHILFCPFRLLFSAHLFCMKG